MNTPLITEPQIQIKNMIAVPATTTNDAITAFNARNTSEAKSKNPRPYLLATATSCHRYTNEGGTPTGVVGNDRGARHPHTG